jgi:hypothetical protein
VCPAGCGEVCSLARPGPEDGRVEAAHLVYGQARGSRPGDATTPTTPGEARPIDQPIQRKPGAFISGWGTPAYRLPLAEKALESAETRFPAGQDSSALGRTTDTLFAPVSGAADGVLITVFSGVLFPPGVRIPWIVEFDSGVGAARVERSVDVIHRITLIGVGRVGWYRTAIRGVPSTWIVGGGIEGACTLEAWWTTDPA